jgi:hypothetical protein
MDNTELQKLRFPVGEYKPEQNITPEDVKNYIAAIEQFPSKLRDAVKGLSDEQLDTRYRPDGWTVRQVVHHAADSHLNSYSRFKLALTEDNPEIRPYFEDRWAELLEAKSAPVELSLPLIESLHKRWVVMLKNMPPEQLKRTFYHPEHKANIPLDEYMHLYAWHCEHHLAHIVNLKERMKW